MNRLTHMNTDTHMKVPSYAWELVRTGVDEGVRVVVVSVCVMHVVVYIICGVLSF